MKAASIWTVAVAIAGQLLFSTCAHAFEDPSGSGIHIAKHADYWEVRLGGGSFDTGPATPSDFNGSVINAEFVVPSPGFLSIIGSPRPYLGSDIALSDDAIHVVYAGLNWEVNLTDRVYLGFSGGGSWNNSPKTTSASGTTKNLGSSILFHLQASAGYDVTETIGIQLFYNHFSNANTFNSNIGLESIGGRLALRF